MKHLINLIKQNEDWLMKRILGYAKAQNYTQYTSTLKEAWRLSISGLSDSLVQGIEATKDAPDFGPDDNFLDDPLTAFGVIEAQRHRERGVTLSMFLGLMKYYKQCYIDLICMKSNQPDDSETDRYIVERSFDRIEIAFCQEWMKKSHEEKIRELQSLNRIMTNEKNAYLTVFESLSDPAIMINKKMEIVNLNHAAATIMDSKIIPGAHYYESETRPKRNKRKENSIKAETKNKIIGQPVLSLFPWLSHIISDIQKNAISKTVYEAGNIQNDSITFFEVTCSKMLDVSEKFTSIILNMRDITERKDLELALRKQKQELEKSNRELDDFAYTVSHDLREPLRGIQNFSTFLQEDYTHQLDEEGQRKIDTIIRLCKREDNLIQSLLRLSRVGRTELELETVDLSDLVRKEVEILNASYQDPHIQFKLPEVLPTIQCDKIRIGEVFSNLLTNAVKYNDNKEKCIVVGYSESIEEDGTNPSDNSEKIQHMFTIQDNGIGIPLKHQEKIFKIFQRLHHRDQFGGGTGAGLTIVKKIIERHGGTIWVQSEPGEGTTFYFTLANELPEHSPEV